MKVYCIQLNNTKCYFDDSINALDDIAIHLESISANDSLKISVLKMSKEEYEKIPEFLGW
jgi:hypothetical protein